MPNSRNRTTEAEIAIAVLKILYAKKTGEASIAQLVTELRASGLPTPEDQQPSTTRTGEELWEQIVRNIKSHKESPTNFINRGLLAEIDDGYTITAKGKDEASKI